MLKRIFFFFLSTILLNALPGTAFSANPCAAVLVNLKAPYGIKGWWNAANEVGFRDRKLFKVLLDTGLIVPGSISRLKKADQTLEESPDEIKVLTGKGDVAATISLKDSAHGPISGIISTRIYSYKVLLDRQQISFHRDLNGKFVSTLRLVEEGVPETSIQKDIQLGAIEFEHLMDKLNGNWSLRLSNKENNVRAEFRRGNDLMSLDGGSLDVALTMLSRRAAIGSSFEPSFVAPYRGTSNDFQNFKSVLTDVEKWIGLRGGSIKIQRREAEFTVRVEKFIEVEAENFGLFIESRTTSSPNLIWALSSAMAENFKSSVYIGMSKFSHAGRGVYNPAKGKIEWRSTKNLGLAGVYNPKTQLVEWKEASESSGIDGVYNPATEKVEWKEVFAKSVKGVYNPETNAVEWQQKRDIGIGGIYNTAAKKIEWQENRMSSVTGVFNPETKQVEWNSCFHCGIAGYYDAILGQVIWWSSPLGRDISIVIPAQNYSSYSANPSIFKSEDRVD